MLYTVLQIFSIQLLNKIEYIRLTFYIYLLLYIF